MARAAGNIRLVVVVGAAGRREPEHRNPKDALACLHKEPPPALRCSSRSTAIRRACCHGGGQSRR